MQDTADVKAVDRAVPSQPCIVARASDGNVKDAFLIIERSPLIRKVPDTKSCLLVLFSSYYAFNVHYPDAESLGFRGGTFLFKNSTSSKVKKLQQPSGH